MSGLSYSAWIRTLNGLVIASALLSALGIVFAVVVSGRCADGGRGGAIAVAMSLVTFFLRLNVSDRVTAALKDVVPGIGRMITQMRDGVEPEDSEPSLEDRVAALEQGKDIDNRAIEAANRKLAMATAIGTLAWGFGDIVAGWFLPSC